MSSILRSLLGDAFRGEYITEAGNFKIYHYYDVTRAARLIYYVTPDGFRSADFVFTEPMHDVGPQSLPCAFVEALLAHARLIN